MNTQSNDQQINSTKTERKPTDGCGHTTALRGHANRCQSRERRATTPAVRETGIKMGCGASHTRSAPWEVAEAQGCCGLGSQVTQSLMSCVWKLRGNILEGFVSSKMTVILHLASSNKSGAGVSGVLFFTHLVFLATCPVVLGQKSGDDKPGQKRSSPRQPGVT